MFRLTNIKGEEFFINPSMIKFVEPGGDTVVTLITGERILVREKADAIRLKLLKHKREVFSALFPEVTLELQRDKSDN